VDTAGGEGTIEIEKKRRAGRGREGGGKGTNDESSLLDSTTVPAVSQAGCGKKRDVRKQKKLQTEQSLEAEASGGRLFLRSP
jgi:hypothetical protein